MQHAFEMLLKAALEQKKVSVFDKRSQKSISLEVAIRQAQQTVGIKLSEEEAGTIRVLDALPDAEQHWYVVVDEGPFGHLRMISLAGYGQRSPDQPHGANLRNAA